MSVREKSSPLNRSGSSAGFSQCVGETVAEVQPGRMIALAEAPPGDSSRVHLLGGDRRQPDFRPLQERIPLVSRRRTATAFHDNRSLQHVDADIRQWRGGGDGGFVALRVRLTHQDGEQCRAVDESPGQSPLVVEKVAMLHRRGSGAQELRERSAMDRSSRTRASTPRLRFSRSRRSCSATVIAPVMVSPVRRASSPASRQVSSFLMLRLIVDRW